MFNLAIPYILRSSFTERLIGFSSLRRNRVVSFFDKNTDWTVFDVNGGKERSGRVDFSPIRYTLTLLRLFFFAFKITEQWITLASWLPTTSLISSWRERERIYEWIGVGRSEREALIKKLTLSPTFAFKIKSVGFVKNTETKIEGKILIKLKKNFQKKKGKRREKEIIRY